MFEIRDNNDIRIFQNLKDELRSVYYYDTVCLDKALEQKLSSCVVDGKIASFKTPKINGFWTIIDVKGGEAPTAREGSTLFVSN